MPKLLIYLRTLLQSNEVHTKVANFTVENSDADLTDDKCDLRPLNQDSDLIEITEAILDKRYDM